MKEPEKKTEWRKMSHNERLKEIDKALAVLKQSKERIKKAKENKK